MTAIATPVAALTDGLSNHRRRELMPNPIPLDGRRPAACQSLRPSNADKDEPGESRIQQRELRSMRLQ